MYDIYYAHHQWKYNTPEEAYELTLIRKYFPRATICNPATDLESIATGDETIIMQECLNKVKDSDIVIFSSINGCIGTGVYHEIKYAQKNGKVIFYIFHDKLTPNFVIADRKKSERSDRLYAFVSVDDYGE